ncbi:hypothetical protein [Streptomyces sp. 1331.2]|uniref:hypothetical protein n=1 Tax=Streptomyces sp. 1331.2 TaxID=1938835 RepID=UPI000BD952EB|nr:hypothetical protein [Streptomyces sp. 1331.2]SOB85277.1 hypothetical protein SAMN06272789_5553 [Streptomyces sp. 1331.2]
MNSSQLFDGVAHHPRQHASPATGRAGSPLRDYVLCSLPAALSDLSAGRLTYDQLTDSYEQMLRKVTPQCLSEDDERTARLLQLDLLFLLSGYAPAGPHAAPRALAELISAQCARFPALDPHLSYELLIDVNCEEYRRSGDIRVFSAGRDAALERDFYLGHHLSEPWAKSAAYGLRSLVLPAAAARPAAVLDDVVEYLAEFTRHMARYRKLSQQAFNRFRPYHMGHPGGPRGASGAFMPSVHLLELALLPPSKEYGIFLDQSMSYFPSWSRPVIARWRGDSIRGANVSQQLRDGRLVLDPAGRDRLVRVIDKFVDFRMAHLGVTRHALPEAFRERTGLTRRDIREQGGEHDILDGRDPGTSGFSVRNVLTNAVYRLLALRADLARPGSTPANQ